MLAPTLHYKREAAWINHDGHKRLALIEVPYLFDTTIVTNDWPKRFYKWIPRHSESIAINMTEGKRGSVAEYDPSQISWDDAPDPDVQAQVTDVTKLNSVNHES